MENKFIKHLLPDVHTHINLSTYKAGLLQSKAHRALTTFMREQLTPYDMTLPEWATLGLAYDLHEIRPSEIADLLGVKPPVATSLLNKLEKKQLVKREQHAGDSRGYVIAITAEGAKLITSVETVLRKELRRYFNNISVKEFIIYIKILSKLAAK